MEKLISAHRWLVANWATIMIVVGLLSAFATYIQARLPKDAAGSITKPTNWGVFLWRLFVDLLSWLPQAGKIGVLGPLSAPGFLSLGDRPTAKVPAGAVPVALPPSDDDPTVPI